MRAWLLVALGAGAVAACGASYSGAPDETPSAVDAGEAGTVADAGDGAAADGDAQPPGTTCDIAKPFGAPVEVALGTGDIRAPSLSPDELTLYFTRDAHIQSATRASRTAPFGGSSDVPSVNGTDPLGTPRPSPDGSFMYLAIGSTTGPFFGASVKSATGYGAPVQIATPGQTSLLGAHPWINPTTTTVYLTSAVAVDGGGELVILHAPIMDAPKIGGAVVVEELRSGTGDYAPVLTADELNMYFASNRTGGQGATDIWRTARPNALAAWGAPMVVAELNSSAPEEPGWLSPDQCRIYLTRGGNGASRILMAERTP